MELDGLPEGLELVRWGNANPAQGEYLFTFGGINLGSSKGFVVRALPGFTIGLNHYTNQYDLKQDFAEPQVVTLRITLRNSRHLEILKQVQSIAQQEQITVETLTPEQQTDGV